MSSSNDLVYVDEESGCFGLLVFSESIKRWPKHIKFKSLCLFLKSAQGLVRSHQIISVRYVCVSLRR